MTRHEKTIAADGVEIATEAFGAATDPPVLLIMGQTASMLWWPDALCERLAAAGRLVIRYDNRDTGRSTIYEPGRPEYTIDDLAGDAAAVLDGYAIDRAHVVGMSMGGMIAQLLARRHPARVASLTVISSTLLGDPDADLPGPDPAYLEHAAAFGDLDWSDREALADLMVRDARAIAGVRHPFDEAGARELVTRDLARARRPESLANHGLVTGGELRRDGLGELRAPLTVIHGTADPIFPPAHGHALATAVPDASLVLLEGGGHELHEGDWPRILDAVVRRTGTAA